MKSSTLNPAPRHGRKFDAPDLQHRASHGLIEVKAAGDDEDAEPGLITGYGSKFGLVDSYNEIVVKGAFKESLRVIKREKRVIPILWQHDSTMPIGGWEEIEEDDIGLKMSGRLDLDTPAGQAAWSAVKKGYVSGLSIGYFEVKADPWSWDNKDPRNLYKLDLRETSVVTFPALKEAQIDFVKATLARGERLSEKQFEKFIAERLNVSDNDAASIVESGYAAWLRQQSKSVAVDQISIPDFKLPTFG